MRNIRIGVPVNYLKVHNVTVIIRDYQLFYRHSLLKSTNMLNITPCEAISKYLQFHIFIVIFSHLFSHQLISNQDHIKRLMKFHNYKIWVNFPIKIPWKLQFNDFLLYFHTYFHILQYHVNYLRIFPYLHKCSWSWAKNKLILKF